MLKVTERSQSHLQAASWISLCTCYRTMLTTSSPNCSASSGTHLEGLHSREAVSRSLRGFSKRLPAVLEKRVQ